MRPDSNELSTHAKKTVNHTFNLAQLPYSFGPHTLSKTHPSNLSVPRSAFCSQPSLIDALPCNCTKLHSRALRAESGLSTSVARVKPRPFTQSDTPPDSAQRRHCLLDLSTAINTPASGLTVIPLLTSSLLREKEGGLGGGGGSSPSLFVLPHPHQSASSWARRATH